jgi:hypothetical protein
MTSSYPPAQFFYAVTPNSAPYTANPQQPQVIDLMITVYNPMPKPVPCTQLVFVLPIGAGNGSLTTVPAVGVAPGQGVPWKITSDGQGNLKALPQPPATGLDVGASIAFKVTGIQVNQLPGLAEILVYEQTDTTRSTQLGISKVPPGLAITSFSASPVQVSPNDPVELAWTTTGATTCTLSWNGQSQNVATSGTYTIRPGATTTVTLNATGASTISQQLTIYVPQVTILSYGASPTQVAQDAPTTLSWLINNADSAVIMPGDSTVDPNSGQLVVSPHLSQSYTLSATGFGRTVSMPAPVEVMPIQVGRFTATPSQVPPGGLLAATLAWSTQWATACAIQPDVGPVGLNGQVSVSPTATTSYALLTTGLNPPTSTATVTVCPGIALLQFAIDPGSGQLSLLWQVLGATAVTVALNSGTAQPVPASGSMPLFLPWPATMTLQATGNGLTSSIQVTLPGQSGGVAVSQLAFACGYGVNAPGAPATLSWATAGTAAAVSGSVVSGGTTTPLSGASSSVVFGIGSDPTLWTTTFAFGAASGQQFVVTASKAASSS